MLIPLVLAIATYGCHCDKVGDNWKVAAWTKEEGRQTGKIIFMGPNRLKALKACDKWMQKTEKEMAKRPDHNLTQCAHPIIFKDKVPKQKNETNAP